MDFAQFDSRTGSTIPRPMQVKHPVTGKPMFDNEAEPTGPNDKPCRVLVLGVEGQAVMAAIRAVRAEPGDKDNVERLIQYATPLVAGFENINRGDKPAIVPDDVSWFLRLQVPNSNPRQRSFVEQVGDFAADRANYLGNSLPG